MRLSILFVVLMSPLSAGANGWLIESPSFGAKDFVNAFPAKLLKEHLSIRLEKSKYVAEVTYVIEGKPQPWEARREMVFPVMCVTSDPESLGKDIPCVHSFHASVDGEPVKHTEETLQNIGYFLDGHQAMLDAGKAAAMNYSSEGMAHNLDVAGVGLKLYRFDADRNAPRFSVTVQYSAPYYFYTSGFSKSPFNYYSNDIVFYDFSPAAKWVQGTVDEFRISVDASAISGEIRFPLGQDFSEENRRYSLEQSNVAMADMPPLVVALERRYEKQYREFRDAIDRGYLTMDIAADKQLDKYPVENATDDDPATAWCVDGESATIEIDITKTGKASVCFFRGLAVINGYAKSESILKANRRVKSGTFGVAAHDPYEHGETPPPEEYSFTLSDYDFNRSWNPFRAVRYFADNNRNENFDAHMAGIVPEGIKSPPDRPVIDLTLRIEDVYAGDTYEDLCVSEVLPLFTCH